MDMDLDELDQAVTKMMERPRGRRGKKAPAADLHAAAAPAPSIPSPVSENSAPSTPTPPVEPPQPAPAPAPHDAHVVVPVNRPMPRVPERRRTHGGAMDIIQPMPKTAPPSARTAREGVSLQPSSSVVPDVSSPAPAPKPLTPPADTTPKPPAALSEPWAAPSEVAPAPPVFKPTTPTDDPLLADMNDKVFASLGLTTKASQPAAPKPPTAHDAWPDPLDLHEASLTAEPAPSLSATKPDDNTSPFLTTKVEKRPLGAYADPAPAAAESAALPPKAELAEASIQSSQHLDADPATSEPDMNDLRQMSIPQQYRTAPRPSPDTVHNVFDTKEYHAAPQMMPVQHKGNSPWLVVGIVVLVVLIVAAITVGYLMMNGTLDAIHL